MPKVLTEAQIEFFEREGYLYPLEGISPGRAAELLDALAGFERQQGVSAGVFKLKAHLCFPEAWDFVREPAILDVAEDLIGPNILAFGSRFWIKPSGDGSFVSWHQDSAYFGCDPRDMVTCWVALTGANEANGCLRATPRRHRTGYPDVLRIACDDRARPRRDKTFCPSLRYIAPNAIRNVVETSRIASGGRPLTRSALLSQFCRACHTRNSIAGLGLRNIIRSQ